MQRSTASISVFVFISPEAIKLINNNGDDKNKMFANPFILLEAKQVSPLCRTESSRRLVYGKVALKMTIILKSIFFFTKKGPISDKVTFTMVILRVQPCTNFFWEECLL